jgi:hypothetical protein
MTNSTHLELNSAASNAMGWIGVVCSEAMLEECSKEKSWTPLYGVYPSRLGKLAQNGYAGLSDTLSNRRKRWNRCL